MLAGPAAANRGDPGRGRSARIRLTQALAHNCSGSRSKSEPKHEWCGATVSLGSVETLVCHPRSTTHSGMPAQELAESGVTDGLVRVSVGIEDWRDLLADFEQALAAVG
ncbi:MAG: PLP-dependent transferase [Bryobacteraceae bacterium]